MSWKTKNNILHYCYGLAGIIIIAILSLLFSSCKSVQYVPVEKVKTEIVHTTDTFLKIDSIKSEKETIIRESRPEDSIMLQKLGIKLQNNERLLILLQKELSEAKSESSEIHYKDSVRIDSIQVPYPVEKKLTKWEQIKMDAGGIAIEVSIVSLLIIVVVLFRFCRKDKVVLMK